MSRDPPRCVFCHEHGASNEHVFAQWISKVVPGDGPFGHGYSSAARRTKDASLLAVKTRAPCVACNTGWMSRLEEAAEPLLSGPITGAGPVDWDSSAQRTIATWATKTALMLDRALLNPRIEARLYAQLYQHGEPPDEFHVWLGSYGLAPDSNQWRAAWADHKTLDATAPSGSLRAVLTTFTVGHVMLQVGSYVREDRQPSDEFDRPPLPLPDGRSLAASEITVQVWPPSDASCGWPPPNALDATGLDLFARHFPYFRMADGQPALMADS